MFKDIILNYLLQMLSVVGTIFLFGFLISLCNKKFYSNFGKYSKAICYTTGVIGTPIHEISHALCCLVFGHKITEIKLFQLNSDDGTLGYVNHSYNKKNLYQRIGNFFIGVAPILVISALLYGLSSALLPSFASNIEYFSNGITSCGFFEILLRALKVIGSFFSLIVSWQWWVFMLISIFLSLHMTLSVADMKGALDGLIFILLIFLVVDVILRLIGAGILNEFTVFIMSLFGYLLCFMTMALFISLIALMISFIYKSASNR